MTHRIAHNLDLGRKLLLAAAATAALAGTVRAQSQAGPKPQFEVTSVKPNKSGVRKYAIMPPKGGRFTATNVTLGMMLRNAYKLQEFQISGGPGWLNMDRYDIEGKAGGDPGLEPVRLMLQSLLADRFQLRAHLETRQLPVYQLFVGKNGPKFKAATCVGQPSPSNPCGGFSVSIWGSLIGRVASLPQLAGTLAGLVGRPVLDRTGLPGNYDFDLHWTPDELPAGPGDVDQAPPDPNAPSLSTALQEQLGLRLESSKGPVELLVIESAEKPSEN